MGIYRVKNWAGFQHYRRDSPVWIKLYRRLLDDEEFHSIDDRSARILVMLWLLASERGGVFTDDHNKIAFRLRLSVDAIKETIPKLDHWIAHDSRASLEKLYSKSMPEERRGEERERRDRGEERQSRGQQADLERIPIEDFAHLTAAIGRQPSRDNGDHADRVRAQAAALKAGAL